LLRKTFAVVEGQAKVAALIFYRRLFELDPSLRPLFRTEIEEQAAKLIEMLGLLISMLNRADALTAELEQLGARHVGYGVKEEHYATVGRALLDMLADVLGSAYTEEVHAAWSDLYNLIAQAMIRGAAMTHSA